MRGSRPTWVARPGPSSRLARFGALASVTLLVSLTASTAVALADDSSPGQPGGVSTTLAPLPTSAPTTTSAVPTTSEPPTTTVVRPPPRRHDHRGTHHNRGTHHHDHGEAGCRPGADDDRGAAGTIPGSAATAGKTTHRGDDKDEHGQSDRQCRPPAAVEPLLPTTTTSTTAPEPLTPGGSVTVDPPPGSADDAPGADADAAGPDELSPIAAADPADPTGGADAAADDTGGDADDRGDDGDSGEDEFAIAAFGDTELSDGVDLAFQGRIGEAPPFAERLWAALPFGLLVGMVLVGMAVLAVRLTRDDLPD